MSVLVEQYDPEWRSHFNAIKTELETYLQDASIKSIEHVGSTSVPGLAAQPIIDINIIVIRPNVQPAIDALLGELGILDRHALHTPNQAPPRNLYVGVDGAFQTRNHISVRETLRKNPDLRDEYGRTKLELAARGTNIVDYVEAKSEIIQKILNQAGLLSEEELSFLQTATHQDERRGAYKTERLVLREFITDDVHAFHALESRPEVVRYQMWVPRTLEQAHKLVVAIIQNSYLSPRLLVELAVLHNDKFIGRVGARSIRVDEDQRGVYPPHVDLWFSFLPEMQGRGFATEAMRAFISTLESPARLEIECDPRNEGCWRLAERLGFERVGLTEKAFECKGEWVDSLVYRKMV